MSDTKVSSFIKNGYEIVNSSRTHSWISDEPIELNGGDTGPKPTELLLSALASCKLITIQMYAQRKGWEIENASVDLKIIGTEEGVTIIEKRLLLKSNLDEQQVNRLKDISGRCPVVKMLSNSIEFRWA